MLPSCRMILPYSPDNIVVRAIPLKFILYI
jgi:hypothetical protein